MNLQEAVTLGMETFAVAEGKKEDTPKMDTAVATTEDEDTATNQEVTSADIDAIR